VFLDERVGVEILAALHQIQVALDLLVGAARVVARRHLVAIHGTDCTPVARGKQILPLLLRRRRRDAGEWNLEPVRNVRTFCRHRILFYLTTTVESYHAATGFSGRIWSSLSAAWKAALFAIIGSIVSSLQMPVVFTTAAMSGAAMSGAIAL